MARGTNPIETPTEPPTEPVVDTPADVVRKSRPGRVWWILSSAAGLGLLVIGLLGGILIGQHLRPSFSAGQDRPAHIFIQRDLPDRGDRVPDRLKDLMPGAPRGDQRPGGEQPQNGGLPPGEDG